MERVLNELPNNCLKIQVPKIVVTNTTIVGIEYEDGVMIGADGRTCIGNHVSNIYRLHDNIYTGATGVGQDTCAVVNLLRSKLEMHHMNTNYRRVPVRCANLMAKKLLHSQGGSLNVNLLIAGVDKYGVEMYSTRFDGSSDTVPFTAMGSGMLTALSVLETRWCEGLDEQTARDVVYETVVIGTGQDVCSRSPVRLCIVRSNFSVEQETLGTIEQPSRPTTSRIVPVIVHESVERVEDHRTLRNWKQRIAEYAASREGGGEKRGGEERGGGERGGREGGGRDGGGGEGGGRDGGGGEEGGREGGGGEGGGGARGYAQ